VYATNWLNVAAIFILMGPDLKAGVGGLGTVTASFYAGIGTMQVPGGILAAKWGPKKIVETGIMMSSVAALATSAATNIPEVAALRFIVGAGMAFVFAPGVILISKFLSRGTSGQGVGVLNSAFDVGGLFGLFGWIVIATITGWRPTLVLSGGLGIATGLLVVSWVPGNSSEGTAALRYGELLRILKDKQLVLIGFGTFGINVGNVLIASFTSYYLVRALLVPPAVGGAVAAMVVAVPIFAAIWGGRLYDRIGKPRRLMLYSLLGTSAALGLFSIHSVLAALAGSLLEGVASGVGFTVAYAAGRDLSPGPKEYDSLAVAWVNSITLSSTFGPPLLYSFLATVAGYPAAWAGSALVSLGMVVPVWMMREKSRP